MKKYPKKIRKALRELVTEVYERELAFYLNQLLSKFHEWKDEKICAGELSTLIHEYDIGQSRKMFSYYNRLDSDVIVARAIIEGNLSTDEVPEEVLQAIDVRFEMYNNFSEISNDDNLSDKNID